MLQPAEPGSRSNRVTRIHGLGLASPWVLGLTIIVLVAVARPATAQPASGDALIRFSIPAQPLVSALRQYGDATGCEAIYDANLARGRSAGEVEGVLTAPKALKRLLAGTGLSARFVADGAFILSMSPSANAVSTSAVQSLSVRRYYALIQEDLLDVLCRQSGTRPGHYRIVVVFRIASSGAIENVRRIGSTGLADADRQIDATLREVRFSEPPPADFAPPVRILILPDAQGLTPACAGADARLRASENGR